MLRSRDPAGVDPSEFGVGYAVNNKDPTAIMGSQYLLAVPRYAGGACTSNRLRPELVRIGSDQDLFARAPYRITKKTIANSKIKFQTLESTS